MKLRHTNKKEQRNNKQNKNKYKSKQINTNIQTDKLQTKQKMHNLFQVNECFEN